MAEALARSEGKSAGKDMTQDRTYIDTTSMKILWWVIGAFAAIIMSGGGFWATTMANDVNDIQAQAQKALQASEVVNTKLIDIERRIVSVEQSQSNLGNKQERLNVTQEKMDLKLDLLLERQLDHTQKKTK